MRISLRNGALEMGAVALPMLCCVLAATLFVTSRLPKDDAGGQIASAEDEIAKAKAERDALQARVEELKKALEEKAAKEAELARLKGELDEAARLAAAKKLEADALEKKAAEVAAAQETLRAVTEQCRRMMTDINEVNAKLADIRSQGGAGTGQGEVLQ